MLQPANDNSLQLFSTIDRAVAGQAITLHQPHRKFRKCYAKFVGHTGDGKHILASKLISSMYRARWTKPLKVERALVIDVHLLMAK